ncbi:MOSC domain-containing protein [Panacagrimonas sp.]|uniref:MOSC domain-containing protein n=1 Tax=Panacagrimonas sp. TaxID=2480088 RepID=UPI003B5281A2
MSVGDVVSAVYVGRVQALPGDGRPTAIFKQAVHGPARLTVIGLDGDAQGDPRVHGGPDKALHQFPVANYARLARAFPDLAAQFVPGAMGENLSTEHADQSNVCIGDVYALGSAQVQLCQPRRPCWKIDARFAVEGICAWVDASGLTGWYYRVLQAGQVQAGDRLRLLQRHPEAPTVEQFLNLMRAHRPQVAELLRIAALPGLNATWAERLRTRARWLHDNSVADSPPADTSSRP